MLSWRSEASGWIYIGRWPCNSAGIVTKDMEPIGKTVAEHLWGFLSADEGRYKKVEEPFLAAVSADRNMTGYYV
jgi:hypothetical protein